MSVFSCRDDKTWMLLTSERLLTSNFLCFPVSLFLHIFKEKSSSVGFLHWGEKGWFLKWTQTVDELLTGVLFCNVTVTFWPLAGGSHRGERRSGELCVLAHPQVDSCSKWCADVSRIPRCSFPKQFVSILQEAGLRPRDFWAFRCGKPAVLHRVQPLLQRGASGSRLLHGVKESQAAGFIVLFNKHEIRNPLWKI